MSINTLLASRRSQLAKEYFLFDPNKKKIEKKKKKRKERKRKEKKKKKTEIQIIIRW